MPLGLTLQELTQPLATSNKLEGQKGLLIKEIDPASFIADVKDKSGRDAFNEGDLIQRINRLTVTDLKSSVADSATDFACAPVTMASANGCSG